MPLDRDQTLRLLLRERSLVLGYLRSLVRDPHLAEDLFQEISVRALDKCGEIADEVHFQGWIRRAGRLEALNLLRKRERGPLPLDDAILDQLESHWDNAAATPAEERLAALRGCVGRLTPRAQSLVRLRYGEGLPGTRVAELVDMTLNTLYVALSRIHRTLAECVRGWDEEERQVARGK